jgi:hypothetical protein
VKKAIQDKREPYVKLDHYMMDTSAWPSIEEKARKVLWDRASGEDGLNIGSGRWCTGKEASEYFQLPYRTLLTLRAAGRLPAGSTLRLGRALRFDVVVIEAGLALPARRVIKKGG